MARIDEEISIALQDSRIRDVHQLADMKERTALDRKILDADIKDKELKNNPIQKGLGRALSSIGNEQAALRSVGSYLAGGTKKVNNLIQGTAETSELGQLFGFSATLRAGA